MIGFLSCVLAVFALVSMQIGKWSANSLIRFPGIRLLFPNQSSVKVISEWCTSCCYPSWPGYYLLTITTFICFNILLHQWSTESKRFHSDATPALAEYSLLRSDSCFNSKVNYLNFWQCLNDRIRVSH